MRNNLRMKKPNPIQTILAVAVCKLTRTILRRTGRGGTALPGIAAMKVSKNILAAVSEGMQIVVVTGTNGKTTTCNMIEHALSSSGHDCLLNRSGANLLHGMAGDLICAADWRGRARHPYAVLECDEAALKQAVPFLRPAVIVVTNLFSDQVDRYGGVGNTLKEIRTGVKRSPDAALVLNAEEPLSASLSLGVPNRVVWYGLDASAGQQGSIDLSDAGVCPRCGSEYVYDYHVYAHLGGFRCPKCGYCRQQPDVAVVSVDRKTADGSVVHIKADEIPQEVHISLPAVYNIYNAAAATAAVKALGLPAEDALRSLSSVRSSFGRLETFDLDGTRLQMILVKNPAGCNQAFSYVTGFDSDYTAVLCLNNRTGDGTDISWIEKADYEKLCADPHLKQLYVCGDKARDLYARLQKAGADPAHTVIVDDYRTLVGKMREDARPVFILPNYTAMMDLRQVLCQETGTRDFWE